MLPPAPFREIPQGVKDVLEKQNREVNARKTQTPHNVTPVSYFEIAGIKIEGNQIRNALQVEYTEDLKGRSSFLTELASDLHNLQICLSKKNLKVKSVEVVELNKGI